jgi:anti-sigma B factor antagonist
MRFTVDKRDKHCIIILLEERLISSISPQLKSELVLMNAEGYRNIILDLTHVSLIDSSGLSAILIGNRVCKEAGGTFVLTGVEGNVRKLIEISQLQNVLNIVPTQDEAEQFVMMEEIERDFKEGV